MRSMKSKHERARKEQKALCKRKLRMPSTGLSLQTKQSSELCRKPTKGDWTEQTRTRMSAGTQALKRWKQEGLTKVRGIQNSDRMTSSNSSMPTVSTTATWQLVSECNTGAMIGILLMREWPEKRRKLHIVQIPSCNK